MPRTSIPAVLVLSFSAALLWLGDGAPRSAAADGAVLNCAASETADEDTLKSEETIDARVVSIRYPPVMLCNSGLEHAIDTFVAGYIENHVRLGGLSEAERVEYLEYATEALQQGFAWTHDMGFSQEFGNARFVSLLAAVWSYTGGAHGNTWFAPLNYHIGEERLIGLDGLFEPGTPYLESIAAFVKEDLYRQKRQHGILAGDSADEDYFIDSGTEPETGNFEVYTFHGGEDGVARGLTFHFPPYQVGAYVEGDFHVTVPKVVFEAFLTKAGRALFQ